MRLNLGPHEVIRFSGPDAVRFLNGQLTQDVGKLTTTPGMAVFSCVTDAKGRLQFRVVMTMDESGAILIAIPAGQGEALEARLTRYLIADDAEAALLPEIHHIHHFIGDAPAADAGITTCSIERFAEQGTDWWVPLGHPCEIPANYRSLSEQEIETLRISRGVPAWGKELTEGILPPEARLEGTDISYQKGCYIGQEVISRIKSAGKVNKLLTRFELDDAEGAPCTIIDSNGKEAGVVTSIAPTPSQPGRIAALGYLKRNADATTLTCGGRPIRIAGSA